SFIPPDPLRKPLLANQPFVVQINFTLFHFLDNVLHVSQEIERVFKVEMLNGLIGRQQHVIVFAIFAMLYGQHLFVVSFVVPATTATDMVGCGVWVHGSVRGGEASLAFVNRAHPVIRVTADWACSQQIHVTPPSLVRDAGSSRGRW